MDWKNWKPTRETAKKIAFGVVVVSVFIALAVYASCSQATGYEVMVPVMEEAPVIMEGGKEATATTTAAGTGSNWYGWQYKVVVGLLIADALFIAYCLAREEEHKELCKRDKKWEGTPFPQ